MAGFGTGAVMAGVANSLLRRSLSEEQLMTLACVACAACSLFLALTSSIASGVLFPLRERREAEPDPLEEFDAPAVALSLKPRSGPIMVKVAYVILEENLEEFLDLNARAPACTESRWCSALDSPAQPSGACAMDGDIPYADLDRLPSPESSSYRGRQGTGRENHPPPQRKAFSTNNIVNRAPHECSTQA
jgi:hypothetical protein